MLYNAFYSNEKKEAISLQAYQIQDNLDFMKKLLIGDTFDSFLLSEATITTYATFRIDGHFHPDYLDSSSELPAAENSGFTLWKRIRPFFFELTKGKNTPLNFHIVFRLAPHNVEKLLAQSGLTLQGNDVDGVFLTIRFDGKALTCVSGTSLRIFSLDKSLEHAWDLMLEKFFRQKGIPFLV
jgi:hypothetical protein